MSNLFVSLSTWFLIFIIYSFAGWLFELLVTIIQGHRVYNRGFLIGPVCPIYGLGGLLITILLSGAESPVTIFCVAFVSSGLLEYLTSYIMEALFHVRWWDYSDMTFNINGRTTLGALLLFGIMGIIVIKIANPFFLNLFAPLDPGLIMIIALLLFIFFVADIAGSLYLILRFRVAAGTSGRDASEEISRNVRELFLSKGKLSRRLVIAFPQLEVRNQPTSRRRPKPKTSRTTKNSQPSQVFSPKGTVAESSRTTESPNIPKTSKTPRMQPHTHPSTDRHTTSKTSKATKTSQPSQTSKHN